MSTPENNNQAMNPQIVSDFVVGTRNLRQLTIYPLSMGDQMELEKLITKFINQWFTENPEGGDNLKFATLILDFLKDNLMKVLQLVTDSSKEELIAVGKTFSNMQTTELVKIIVETNYQDPYEKNLKSLPLMQNLFQLGRQLPSLSEDIRNIESNTSTPDILKTEASPKTNSNSSSKKPTRKKKPA